MIVFIALIVAFFVGLFLLNRAVNRNLDAQRGSGMHRSPGEDRAAGNAGVNATRSAGMGGGGS
jgi:hypothetical protein